MRINSLLCLLTAALLVCPALSHAQSYIFTNFDGPPDNGGGTTINGINNNGAEVGFSSNVGATVLTNFIRNPDGTFTLLNIGGNATAMANGINNSNAVVGANGMDAFLLSGGMLTTLPQANPGNTLAEVALGINDHGVIVGTYADNTTTTAPGFVDNNGTFTILNPVAGALATNAQGINNNGLVTGFYSTNANPAIDQHGFLYDTTTGHFTLLPDPSTPKTAGGNLLLTQFLGINDQGEAVGYYQTADTNSQFGFLFNTNTDTYTFLDDPLAAPVNGTQITQITGINDLGDLSGFYIDANGVQHGFFAFVVPEPGALALLIGFGVSGSAFAFRRLRRR